MLARLDRTADHELTESDGAGGDEPGVRSLAIDNLSFTSRDDVTERHPLRGRVVAAHVGVDEQLHLRLFRSLQRECRDTKRQRRHEEWRGEAGRYRLTRGPRPGVHRPRGEDLPARPNDRAA